MGDNSPEPTKTDRTTLVTGGKVHLMDGVSSPQEAIVVHNGRVLASGTEADMVVLAGKNADRINVRGATVMPGLVDTHPHVLHFTARLRASVDITDAKDHADIVARIRARAAVTPRGEWIITTPVGEPHFFIRRSYRDLAERRLPDRYILDQATSDHPVFIQAWGPTTPNVCVFNSKGLQTIGMNDLLPDRVCDVFFEKDDDGKLTGVIRGAVANYYNIDPYWTQIQSKLPGPAGWELHESTIFGISEINRQGVTTIYEPHNITPGHVEAYIRLRKENALTARVMLALEAEGYAYPPHWSYSTEQFEERLELGRRMLDRDDELLRITGVTFSPATPCGSGMVRMHEPYRGPFGENTRGVTFLSREKQRRFICFCAEHSIRGNFCTYGYRDHDDISGRPRIRNRNERTEAASLADPARFGDHAAAGGTLRRARLHPDDFDGLLLGQGRSLGRAHRQARLARPGSAQAIAAGRADRGRRLGLGAEKSLGADAARGNP